MELITAERVMQPTSGDTTTVSTRPGKRRRWFRVLFTVVAGTLLLEWWMVRDYRIWRGPNYGVLIEARGDLLWEAIYRTDTQSIECSVWRLYD